MKLIALNDAVIADSRSTALDGLTTNDAATASVASDASILSVTNDANPLELPLDGVRRVELNFPKFNDGRAYSQAFMLRRRRGFKGEIRATGDVLIDQLVQMKRSGFDTAVLREDLDLPGVDAVIARQFERYAQFYQGDAVTAAPLFARSGA
jgi:uncharacterized protein (DUF934 family)